MATNKRKVRKGNFLKRVQSSTQIKSIRKKIREHEAKRKKLSAEYKRTIKTVSRRLSK